MNKILGIYVLVALVLSTGMMATAVGPSCSSDAEVALASPDGMMVACDDPDDSTCEQDFETLCPANWHLCAYDEFNAHNDGMSFAVDKWGLGQIQCRDGYGAGHFTVWDAEGNWDIDRADNMYAGSSISGVCASDYGCNEQMHYALCCYGDGPIDDDEPIDGNVPEFTLIGAGLTLAIAGIFVYRMRK